MPSGCFKEQNNVCRRFPHMIETPQQVLESSFRIAWDYLEATGELGQPDAAAAVLLDAIGTMMSRGEYRTLLLSNRAITAYQRRHAKQDFALVS
jgi:hypothetical protein